MGVSKFLGLGFTIEIDNYTSDLHTVVYLTACDRKGAFYDLMRSLKDVELNVSYGKIEAASEVCQFTLFVSTDGGKITDEDVLRPNPRCASCARKPCCAFSARTIPEKTGSRRAPRHSSGSMTLARRSRA